MVRGTAVKNSKAAVFLLISQSFYAIFVSAWIFFALMTAMMFDSPDAARKGWVWAFVAYIWIYPLVLIATATVSWVLYHFRKFRGAVWTNLIPALWVVPGIVLIVVLFN